MYYYLAPIFWFKNLGEALSNVAWAAVRFINLLNYSCNLYIYLLSGKTFRDEAKKLFLCAKRSISGEMNSQLTMSTNSVQG